MTMDDITADDVRALIDSPAADAAMVRYPDGSVDVRSTVPTGDPVTDGYRIIVSQDELSSIDQSGMDFDALTDDDIAALAKSLTISDATATHDDYDDSDF